MNPDIQPVSSPWVTDDRGHVRLASPPATLPGPAKPGLAYPDPMWSVRRLGVVEKHRRAYADEVARKDAEIVRLSKVNDRLSVVLERATDDLDRVHRENARLRAHLAAAGTALDGLTKPGAAAPAAGETGE